MHHVSQKHLPRLAAQEGVARLVSGLLRVHTRKVCGNEVREVGVIGVLASVQCIPALSLNSLPRNHDEILRLVDAAGCQPSIFVRMTAHSW